MSTTACRPPGLSIGRLVNPAHPAANEFSKSLRNRERDWTRAASRSWVKRVPRTYRNAMAPPPLIAPSGSIWLTTTSAIETRRRNASPWEAQVQQARKGGQAIGLLAVQVQRAEQAAQVHGLPLAAGVTRPVEPAQLAGIKPDGFGLRGKGGKVQLRCARAELGVHQQLAAARQGDE